MAKRKTVVGVSWRRLQGTPSPSNTPSGRPGLLRSQVSSLVQEKVMSRMTSFRGTLDTLRQVFIIIIINEYPEAGRRPLFPSEVHNFNTNINKN